MAWTSSSIRIRRSERILWQELDHQAQRCGSLFVRSGATCHVYCVYDRGRSGKAPKFRDRSRCSSFFTPDQIQNFSESDVFFSLVSLNGRI